MFMRTFLSFLFLSKVEKSIKPLNNQDDLTVSKRAGTRYGIKIHFLFLITYCCTSFFKKFIEI